MLECTEIEKLNDYFVDLNKRKINGVYFYRIIGYNQQINDFILKYYDTARLNGVVIEGGLPNPSNDNLAFYNEIMGMSFQMSMGFIESSLKKWLPRMNGLQRKNVAAAIYDTLDDLRRAGKNDNMLKNAYIKFMCWLYYKFERIVNHLGEQKLPKILYEGKLSSYGLLLMNVLSLAGCDIVLLQYSGDEEYLKLDPKSLKSKVLSIAEMTAFPSEFSLKKLRIDMQEQLNNERLYGKQPNVFNCTNAWVSGKPFDDIKKEPLIRGNDAKFYYNCFFRINGAEDKLTYENELYQLQQELISSGRNVVIADNLIAPPSIEEINTIHRKKYDNINQMIIDLSTNIKYSASRELQQIMNKAFIDILLEESKRKENNLNRLTNKAVYIICWLKRFENALFRNWKYPEISCFFHMGGCKNNNESLFCRYLSRLPVDVAIFNPNLNIKCCLEDKMLYEVNNDFSLDVEKYPQGIEGIRVGTTAYHAERELDTLMYTDSGMYRNQQYDKAISISLKTMYEEISILWQQELRYRPNFSTVNDTVNMPVIFSKISGVKDSALNIYWNSIKNLITSDTKVIKKVPNILSTSDNTLKPYGTEFFKHGRVQKSKIKAHRAYKYGIIRESMQDYLLDKIQLLIDQKVIKGTFENGAEYTIVSTALNLDKDILRMIQRFDFTKTNPKLIYIITGETELSLEDSIYAAFLNLIGFDIVFFVPTGYRCIEKYFNKNIIEDHFIGEFMYDLNVPDFETLSTKERPTWRERIFGKGI